MMSMGKYVYDKILYRDVWDESEKSYNHRAVVPQGGLRSFLYNGRKYRLPLRKQLLLRVHNQLISVHKYPFNFFFFKLSSKTNFLLQILYPFTPNSSMFVIDCYFPRHIMIQTLPSTCFNSLFEEISEKLACSKIFEILMIFEILTDCHCDSGEIATD